MLPNIGPTELVILIVVLLVVFGPKRLPSIGRSLGSGMREFKDSITGKAGGRQRDEDKDGEDERRKPTLERPATRDDHDTVRAAADELEPESTSQS